MSPGRVAWVKVVDGHACGHTTGKNLNLGACRKPLLREAQLLTTP